MTGRALLRDLPFLLQLIASMLLRLRALQSLSIQVSIPNGPWYPSRLIDFTEGESIVIDPPVGPQGAMLLDVGTPVVVEIPLPDGLRRFPLTVKECDRYRNMLRIEWPDVGEKIQRRNYVRVPVRFGATISFDQAGDNVDLKGITSDLSAGGVRINVAQELRAGLQVKVRLELPDSEVQEFEGHVVRCGDLNSRTEERYWVAVVFTNIDPAVQREITRAVFDIQREQMKRAAY